MILQSSSKVVNAMHSAKMGGRDDEAQLAGVERGIVGTSIHKAVKWALS
jgi:hypothetical protein